MKRCLVYHLKKTLNNFFKQEEGTTTLQCVEDSLGAASDCLLCICEVIDEIIGGDGICNNDNPIKTK
jgi:hypothetical protein